LPTAWANELRNKIEEHEKIGKAARADPHVKAAVDVFNEYAPGILKDKASAQYAAAVGELSSTVQAKVSQLKRNLTYDENKAAVLTVIRNQNISLDAGSPLTIPSKEYNAYMNYARQQEPGITDQQVKERYQQWIMYGQYRALLEKTPPAKPAPTAPAATPSTLFNPGRM
jgi:hypothetical protein